MKTSQKYYYNIRPEMLSLRHTCQPKWGNTLLGSVATIHNAVVGVVKSHGAQQVPVVVE
jgi:hypothetical protein